ncbi:MAG: gluconeogenesis factor YvcK family protein [Patescibacteria group bacterium]
MKEKRIVTIGGGTGSFTVLNALKKYPGVRLSAIVSMADDGGSTGALRDQYGVLPPGDVRRALVALSESSETLRELFNFRFRQGSFHGHSFGNLFLSALEKVTGNFSSAVQEASRILNICGEVIPVTLDDVRLRAELADGTVLRGEGSIDVPKGDRAHITRVWLEPKARMNPRVNHALSEADCIIIGPGDVYTSIVPNFLVSGVASAFRKSKAKKIYVVNLMTKWGETDGFNVRDFTREIERYAGKGMLDCVLFNITRPPASVLKTYAREKAEFVKPIVPHENGTSYIGARLIHSGKLIRHDPRKLAKAIFSLL